MANSPPLDQAAAPDGPQTVDGPVKKTGKVDAARIPLDYHKHKDNVTVFKNGLTLAFFVCTTGLLLTIVNWSAFASKESETIVSPMGQYLVNHGPLSNVHATLEKDCEACHISFVPIKDSNVLTAVDRSSIDRSNRQCNACHFGSPHHANEKEHAAESCSHCHVEHKGRDASLVSLTDNHCTSCHANVEEWLADKNIKHVSEGWQSIPRFSEKDHPKFKSITKDAEDPGNIKFNHWLHLSPGLGLPGKTAWNYGDLPEKTRASYISKHENGDATEQTTIQLSCNACHELQRPETDGSIEGLVANRMGGAHFLPVNFERHCQSCHPLSAPGLAGPGDSDGSSVYQVPHDLQPADLLELVRGKAAMTVMKNDGQAGKSKRSPHPAMPGQAEEVAGAAAGNRAMELKLTNTTTRIMQGMLGPGETCSKCHFYTSPDGATLAALSMSQAGNDIESFTIAEPGIPTDWFRTARFNHSAHRAWSCLACHAEAVPPSKDMTIDQLYGAHTQKSIMVPDIDNCVECHAPTYRRDGKIAGGIRHGCTDCHKYHNVDRHWVESDALPHDHGLDDVTVPLSKIREMQKKLNPKKDSK